MTKYCPQCESEYKDNLNICPDDGKTLSIIKPQKRDESTSCDIYAAAGEIEAERIVSFLEAEGISAYHTKNTVSQLPTNADMHFIISVPVKDKNKSVSQIKNAIDDGVISTTGSFL